MAAKQDEQRKVDEDPLKHLDQLEPSRLQSLAEQIAPQVAPPAAALLPQQTDPTREQAKELLSHWVEEGGGGANARLAALLQEEEEREGRHRDALGRTDQGGEGGHTEADDRRS